MQMTGVIPQILKQCPENSLYVRFPDGEPDCAEMVEDIELAYVIKIAWKADPRSNYTLILIGNVKLAKNRARICIKTNCYWSAVGP